MRHVEVSVNFGERPRLVAEAALFASHAEVVLVEGTTLLRLVLLIRWLQLTALSVKLLNAVSVLASASENALALAHELVAELFLVLLGLAGRDK